MAVEEINKSDDFNWGSDTPVVEIKKEESIPKIETEKMSTIEKEIHFKAKMRERVELERAKYPDKDVELMWFVGPRQLYPYIVRSFDMADMSEVQIETKESIQNLMEQYKSNAKKNIKGNEKAVKSIDEIAAQMITDADVQDMEWENIICKAVLYPENIREIMKKKQMKPGHYRGVLEMCYALAGYTPPIYDSNEETQDAMISSGEFPEVEGAQIDKGD